ncbi:MAG TPA: gluconate 2-dehydrogenase subunit 3 family protein [Candidatus Sulfotelmatobacter sp.]|nr:gluconate 2-dehydrogenase subunit 3 family protein [Candidatus Sulfotelmatobacter sp.]
MQRREVLRLLATGTALQLAPHQLFGLVREVRSLMDGQVSLGTLNPHQYATVKTMAELIIPRTNTPGATDVKTAEFIDLMLTEWYEDAERKRFLGGLEDVDLRSTTLFGKAFVDSSAGQQAEILRALGETLVDNAHASRRQSLTGRGAAAGKNFYSMFRQLTLTAYYTSEAGATQELHFEIVPSDYNGCGELPIAKEAPQK